MAAVPRGLLDELQDGVAQVELVSLPAGDVVEEWVAMSSLERAHSAR